MWLCQHKECQTSPLILSPLPEEDEERRPGWQMLLSGGLTGVVAGDAVEAEIQVFQEMSPFVYNKVFPYNWAFGSIHIAAPGISS